MSDTLRHVSVPDSPPFLDARLVGTKMQGWLDRRGSPFGVLKIKPSEYVARAIGFDMNAPHWYAVFNGACARHFQTPPHLGIVVPQAEQGAMSFYGELLPEYEIKLLGGDCNGPHPEVEPGWETIQGKNGWVAWRGQKMLVELCGAGIMAKKYQKLRQTEYYLGVDRQIYWTHRIASGIRAKYDDPRNRIMEIINLNNERETVVCDDPNAFYVLTYNPYETELAYRKKIWDSLKLP